MRIDKFFKRFALFIFLNNSCFIKRIVEFHVLFIIINCTIWRIIIIKFTFYLLIRLNLIILQILQQFRINILNFSFCHFWLIFIIKFFINVWTVYNWLMICLLSLNSLIKTSICFRKRQFAHINWILNGFWKIIVVRIFLDVYHICFLLIKY